MTFQAATRSSLPTNLDLSLLLLVTRRVATDLGRHQLAIALLLLEGVQCSARLIVFSMPCPFGCILSCRAAVGACLCTPDLVTVPKMCISSLDAICVDDILWAMQQFSFFDNVPCAVLALGSPL